MLRLIFLFSLLLLPGQAMALDVPPKPVASPVVDQANVLTTDQESALAAQIEEARKVTGNQIGVLVIPSLDGEVLEDYSIRVARAWGIGTSENDNGVLLLAAIEDRKLRIEVGYGLEGALTDLRSSRIIRDRIAPEFREENYYGGLSSGLEGILAAIKDEVDPQLGSTGNNILSNLPFELIFFVLFFVPTWISSILARTKSWWAGGVMGAVVGVVVGIFFGFLFIGIIAIILLVLSGLLFDRAVSRNYIKRKSDGLAPSWWAGGTTLGGKGESSWGGFGGGGFGGGGSSGSW